MSAERATRRDAADMADLARHYCRLIESIGSERDPRWLREVFTLLPKLHIAVVSLDGDDRHDEDPALADADNEQRHVDELEHRFELYSRVRRELGEHDNYWLEFDPVGDGHGDMSGSLADDLVDIYHDIKGGLDKLPEADDAAIDHWKRTYRLHWGQHLVDAERHLYALKARNSLEP